MSLDEIDYTTQIVNEVGDPNGTISNLVSGLWVAWASKGTVDLQYLYTKRSCIDVRLAEEQPTTNYTVHAISTSGGQAFDHLQKMRDDCHAEILRVENIKRGTRLGFSGLITKTAPESNPVTGSTLDANHPRYAGDPYYPATRRS